MSAHEGLLWGSLPPCTALQVGHFCRSLLLRV